MPLPVLWKKVDPGISLFAFKFHPQIYAPFLKNSERKIKMENVRIKHRNWGKVLSTLERPCLAIMGSIQTRADPTPIPNLICCRGAQTISTNFRWVWT